MLKRTLIVRFRSSIHVVPMGEILYLENRRRIIRVHTSKNDYLFYARFDDVMPDLDRRFSRCHRSYILNLDRITFLENMRIGLDDTEELKFGKATFLRLKKEFEDYSRWKREWIRDDDKRRGLR